MRLDFRAIAPVFFRHAIMFQHHFRPQPSGRQRNRRRVVLGQILRMRPAHAIGGGLHQIVERRQAIMRGIVLRGAVGHLDQQAARFPDQQRQREMRGDEVRVEPEPEQPQSVFQMVLPHRLVPFEQQLTTPDIIDQHVQPALFGVDPLDQRFHLLRLQMVGRHGDALAAGGCHQFGRLLDRLGRAPVLRLFFARRPSGNVDCRTGRAQLNGDASASAARTISSQSASGTSCASIQSASAFTSFDGI